MMFGLMRSMCQSPSCRRGCLARPFYVPPKTYMPWVIFKGFLKPQKTSKNHPRFRHFARLWIAHLILWRSYSLVLHEQWGGVCLSLEPEFEQARPPLVLADSALQQTSLRKKSSRLAPRPSSSRVSGYKGSGRRSFPDHTCIK